MGFQLNRGKCEVIFHSNTVITDPYLSSFVSVCVAHATLLVPLCFTGPCWMTLGQIVVRS